jgi:hypothetical protein
MTDAQPNLLLERLKELQTKAGFKMPPCQPVYDRVFIYPTDGLDQDEKIAGTSLYRPSSDKTSLGASRGVLIAAGLKALDQLYGHGIELGHIVWFARLSPWQRQYEGDKRIERIVILRASEVVGSEDLMTAMLRGQVEVGVDDSDGRHVLVDRKRRDPEETDEGI